MLNDGSCQMDTLDIRTISTHYTKIEKSKKRCTSQFDMTFKHG